ncbi:hypothetical protein AMS68_004578 [Peltaster fructicola]|uniref:SET domain-containing protein n=1 Tax=Peltaster fructicola TaxID=286661 RepID=A0A6H0XWM2_9PEZI|nr:hypothetical protein AMS68_004578 [Peltaster fructicola]
MDRARALENWLRSSSGGQIHPHVHLAEDAEHGLHWKAEQQIVEGTKILTVPHSHALSYLNALVDDAYPIFKARRRDFTIEAIGFFYLMLQYVDRRSSFWKPYLETLPPPSDQLTTPLWFDDADDARLLADTDVAHTMNKRRAIYEDYYTSGTAILKESGIDVSHFSWDLFRWAITMFTSRSFPSRSIAPNDGKYWTTYKTGQNGQRQTVLLDMSHTPAEDLDFSVLFPVIDAGNHNYQTRVHWDFDPGRFSITNLDSCSLGAQIFNNYGPKANDELLQGYGFCIEDNPFDVVLLTLRPPPEDLQAELRSTHSGYFDVHGQWQSDKATFRLPRIAQPLQVFDRLPPALLELLTMTICHQSGIEFTPHASSALEQRLKPHVARVVIGSLTQKYQRLASVRTISDRSRLKQVYAMIYRQSQIDLTRSYVEALQGYLQSLTLHTEPASPVRLVSLETMVADSSLLAAPVVEEFLAGVEVNANTSDIEQLKAAGWEDDVWVLLLCYAWVSGPTNQEAILPRFVQEYVNMSSPRDDDKSGEVDDLLSLVTKAAEHLPSSSWADPAWSAEMISRIGGRILRNESFTLPAIAADGETDMVTYLCVSSKEGFGTI